MWFYDWLTIRQQHYDVDIVGKNVCIWVDPSDGTVISEGVGYLSHEGSYSTAVQIRSYGGLVEWSGNPSRWNRPDNLFGFTTLEECVSLVNQHLAVYGLPPFTKGGNVQHRRNQIESDDVSLANVGAVITRIDVTRNVSCGDRSGLDSYIRAASSAVYRGGNPAIHPGSVAWGTARNTRIKMYDKGSEILAHNKKLLEPSVVEYRKRLSEWCYNNGILRQEITFGRQSLRNLGLRSLDEFEDHRCFEYALERLSMINIGCTTGLSNTFDQFIDCGFSKTKAARLSGIVSQWYMGESPKKLMSSSAYYRARADIKSVVGVDIGAQANIDVLSTRVRDVQLSEIEPPHWYAAA